MEFLLNFNSWYKALPASGKMSLLLVFVGVLVASFLLKNHYDTAGYQYLFTNLSLSDSNAIAQKLQSMNVNAQIQGDAILVPGNKVLELRNLMAEEGLPSGGGIGFEIFDKKNFGETEFQQRMNYIRAIQGELARTITAIDGVDKARVHLVVPEKALFSEDQKSPTASIAISMKKGRKLSDTQIHGVVHLVITSVEGMTESGVSVIDQNGNTLYKGSSEGAGGALGGKQMELQASIEKKLEAGVKDLLERIVGSGGVSVKVSSTLAMTQVEKMVEAVDPESRVALSEQTSTETSNGSSGGSGGTPGSASNLPGGAAAGSQGRSENSKKVETTATYAVTRTTQKIVEPYGTIQKLSVAVLVDGTYTTAEDGKVTYQPRAQDELNKMQEVVKKAVGFSQDRGDEVRVENFQFQRLDGGDKVQENYIETTSAARWKLFLMDNGKLLGVVLIAGIIFLMLVKLVNSYAPPVNVAYANIIGQQAAQIAQALPAAAQINVIQKNDAAAQAKIEQMARAMPEAVQRKDAGGGPAINFVESNASITVESPVTSEEKLRLQAAKMQVEQIIQKDANEAVAVIREWLGEG